LECIRVLEVLFVAVGRAENRQYKLSAGHCCAADTKVLASVALRRDLDRRGVPR
jgi:hypothetical protein